VGGQFPGRLIGRLGSFSNGPGAAVESAINFTGQIRHNGWMAGFGAAPLLTIADVNQFSGPEFVERVGWVFEQSPWVAERVSARKPFRSIDDLHIEMVATVLEASREEQLALLRAYPDLGTRARMSDSAAWEQASAGLDQLSPEAFDRLSRLNAAYQQKFGFPFLFAAKGSTSQEIMRALERRLACPIETEFQEALRQVFRIARFRLEELIGPGI